jgi:hypothetical protein
VTFEAQCTVKEFILGERSVFAEEFLCALHTNVHRASLREGEVHAILMLFIVVEVAIGVAEAVVALWPVAVWIVAAPDVPTVQFNHLGVPDVATKDCTDLHRLVVITEDVEDVSAANAWTVAARLL